MNNYLKILAELEGDKYKFHEAEGCAVSKPVTGQEEVELTGRDCKENIYAFWQASNWSSAIRKKLIVDKIKMGLYYT